MRRPTSKLRSVYISGPMTGLPDLNHPAFLRLEKIWRKWGWTVANPVTINPANAHSDLTPEEVRAVCIWTDLEAVRDTDALVLMRGWERSIGARAEVYLARSLNHPIFDAVTCEMLTIE